MRGRWQNNGLMHVLQQNKAIWEMPARAKLQQDEYMGGYLKGLISKWKKENRRIGLWITGILKTRL